MKGTNVDWCTPQILEEMMKDPVLKEGLTNPAIAGIMQDMAKDPKVLFLNFFFKNQKCLQKHGSNPQLAKFIEKFCQIMAVNIKAVVEDTVATKTSSERQISEEQKRSWIANPDIMVCMCLNYLQNQRVLDDPFTVFMIQDLQKDPSNFPKYQSTPQMKALIKVGIIQNPNVLN